MYVSQPHQKGALRLRVVVRPCSAGTAVVLTIAHPSPRVRGLSHVDYKAPAVIAAACYPRGCLVSCDALTLQYSIVHRHNENFPCSLKRHLTPLEPQSRFGDKLLRI